MELKPLDHMHWQIIDARIAPIRKLSRKLFRLAVVAAFCTTWNIITLIIMLVWGGAGIMTFIPAGCNIIAVAALITTIHRASDNFHQFYIVQKIRMFSDFWLEQREWPGFFVLLNSVDEEPIEHTLVEYGRSVFALKETYHIEIDPPGVKVGYFVLFKDPDDAMIYKLTWAS